MVRLLLLVLSSLILSISIAAARPSQGPGGSVIINRSRLSSKQLDRLQERIGAVIPPGRYWYDKRCGVWGKVGRGAGVFLPAGLDVPGRLSRRASAGNTGVFINGRELHQTDVAWLRRSGVPVQRGRFWLDGRGVGGWEGRPASFNLAAIISRAQAVRRQNKSVLTTWDKTGVAVF